MRQKLDDQVRNFLETKDDDKINILICTVGKLIKEVKELESRIEELERDKKPLNTSLRQ